MIDLVYFPLSATFRLLLGKFLIRDAGSIAQLIPEDF